MSAESLTRSASGAVPLAAALLLASVLAGPARSDDVPSAREAVERARALARSGQTADAEVYLSALVDGEGAPYSRNAEVLIEAARVARLPETSRAYAHRVIERTRSAELLEQAHLLRGDSFFAEGLYKSAAIEFEQAARHSGERGASRGDLRRADSILAAGDAGAAVEAYASVAQAGATPGETTPAAELGLARALLLAGRAEEAAEQFERTARAYAEHQLRPRALAGAAESRESLGDYLRASEILTELLTDHPGSYEAVLARERLRTYVLPDSTGLGAAAADSAATSLDGGAPGDAGPGGAPPDAGH